MMVSQFFQFPGQAQRRLDVFHILRYQLDIGIAEFDGKLQSHRAILAVVRFRLRCRAPTSRPKAILDAEFGPLANGEIDLEIAFRRASSTSVQDTVVAGIYKDDTDRIGLQATIEVIEISKEGSWGFGSGHQETLFVLGRNGDNIRGLTAGGKEQQQQLKCCRSHCRSLGGF